MLELRRGAFSVKVASGASSARASLPFLPPMVMGLAAAKLTLGASASSTVMLGRTFLAAGAAEGADADELKSTESNAETGPLQTFVMNAVKIRMRFVCRFI